MYIIIYQRTANKRSLTIVIYYGSIYIDIFITLTSLLEYLYVSSVRTISTYIYIYI